MELLSLKKDEIQEVTGTLHQKVSRAEFEEVLEALSRQKAENQRIAADLEHVFEVVKTDLEGVRQNTLAPKIDVDEIDKILQILNRKPDIDQVNVSLIKLRDEVSEEISALKEEILSQIKEMETEALKKATQADALYEEISLEVRELNTQIRKVLEDKGSKRGLEDTNGYVNKALQEFQNDIIEEFKRIDDKCNQISQQKDAQIKDLGNYLQRIPENLKSEVQEELQKMADVINRLKNVNGGQLEEANKLTKRIAENLQQEFHSEVGRLEDRINQLKGMRDAQADDTNKTLKKSFDSIKQELYGELQRMDDRINQLKGMRDTQADDTNKTLKKSFDSIKQELYGELQQMDERINQIGGQLNETFQKRKVDAGEFEAVFARIQEQLDSKTDLSEVQEVLNSFSQEISKKFMGIKDDFTQVFKEHEEIFTALKKKANLADLNSAIAKLESTLMNWIENFENSQQKSQRAQERQVSQGKE